MPLRTPAIAPGVLSGAAYCATATRMQPKCGVRTPSWQMERETANSGPREGAGEQERDHEAAGPAHSAAVRSWPTPGSGRGGSSP
ncbi:hypothetical protein [Streptomyces sp. NPDC059893]|uniref:hypothetical protein n=1 Tax=Streptomyces sp. NPDC059893 TaxID=3346990 RepID=UPI003658CA43